MKKLFLLGWLYVVSIAAIAQPKSPEAFLGYKIGSRYTPHHKIVDYFNHLAASSPMVALQQYGETNQHRPLLVVFIGNAENVANREEIRMNNLRLANQARDKRMPSEQGPVVVWLSYNVHGNETSSSEAAMATAYALITEKSDYLSNTLVVIDPCLNPDGRDRYINWYNATIGKFINPNRLAREHREPWPQGRSNHYNFDLNRDWAWQTQVESRQRVPLYNSWLPQVHVDFHEQGINEPYYFAPAAEPFHELITPWQREFQHTIGRNHARYFDDKGWLYFTRERFDLLYPSYGDTYPIYNGSIGMTYEQGGIGAGLAIRVNEGDTLTLTDRVGHHTTTGLSTVEISSKNAAPLVNNFRKFFNDAVQGKTGRYKTFVIRHAVADEQRLEALKTLLKQNGIDYGAASGNGRGFNYFSKKEEAFNIGPKDLVISAKQPKAALVQVLFEPQTKISDSATYDITAWALPYCYGLTAYASTQDFSVGPYAEPEAVKNTVADPFAYIIPWSGMGAAKTVISLMQQGIRVRYSQAAFTVGGQAQRPGAMIVMKNGNANVANLWQIVRQAADKNNVHLFTAGSGMVEKGIDFGSSSVRALKAPRVYVVTGEGVSSLSAGEVWSFFDNELHYPATLINLRDMANINWGSVDVLVLPEGRYPFLASKELSEAFLGWVRNGGRVIALGSTVAEFEKLSWSGITRLNKPDSANKEGKVTLSNYADMEREFLKKYTPGSIFKVDVDNTHPLFYGYPRYYYSLKLDGDVYGSVKDGLNVGVFDKDAHMAGFVGSDLKREMVNGMVFGVKPMGAGEIIYLTDNVLFRNFWENGKLLFTNAVFVVGRQDVHLD